MIPLAKQMTMPYRAMLVVRNPRGVECRLPMIAHATDAATAKQAAMDKARAYGHDVVSCDSVELA